MLPKWVKVSEERFDKVLSTVTNAKNEGLKVNVDGREIMLDKSLKDLGNGILDGREFKNRYNDIADDAEVLVNKSPLTKSQYIILLLKEIWSDRQPNTTDMPELESEESAAERRNQPGQGLKILTPDQMLSRLPITLAQLKAGNNSEKLKNEIRQLLYSLYRSKKLTKQLYKSLVDII